MRDDNFCHLHRSPLFKEENKEANALAQAARHRDDDPHLRSSEAVKGYHIRASDGDIGHVQGLLVDEETWAIRYIIVDTSNWWLGHQALIAPQWIQGVSWPDAKVSVNLTRQAVKDSPPYDAAAQLDRKQESRIYKHYGRPGYWENVEDDRQIPGTIDRATGQVQPADISDPGGR